ncbi:MAG TPA: aspartate aminotransferase family protein, partial [Acidaminococcaceae bacterium]|nr:aspartate aminotransferase family protein [Acidaminococcaceae bacterium]
MSKLQELDQKYVANTYARFPVEIVGGKGSIVKDAEGKEYIDMGSGIGVTSF